MLRISTFFLAACLFIAFAPRTTCAEDFADQLPRIAPTEPEETLADFQVAKGFEIQLVASEPLVTSPVAIEWDAAGKLYVCEMRGYSEDRNDAISRVTCLTDQDGDGVYDRKTNFAEGLLWPTAIFPYDGGLFVADAPDIFYFKDEDGDAIADTKKVVFTGFSAGNVQGLLNSFRWGLDNRIHLACGTVGGKVRRPSDPVESAVEVRGHDLAFDPVTFEFALTSGGAQHGMCFDDWGRKFVSSNSDHLQQIMFEDRYIARNSLLSAPPARLSIAVDGPQAEVFRISPIEPWRIVRTRLRVAGLVRGPIEGGGRAAGYFTGATGVTIYRGDAWPESYRSLAIVGDVGSNLVHRKRLTPNGIALQGRRIDQESEFIASKDNWFRPAQFACGPDGALTIIDVYREVIEHPKSLPPVIKRHLDLTSGRDRGRIYRVAPHGYSYREAPDFASVRTADLVNFLDHANAWHRETAARLIFERQDVSIEDSLRQQSARAKSALGRMHSLYALDGLGLLKPRDVMDRMDDPHPQVVRHAVRLSENFTDDASVVEKLGQLTKHPSIDVRYQLAFTLGEFPIPDRSDWLARILFQNPTDRWITTAVSSSSADAPDELFVALMGETRIEPRLIAPVLGDLARQIDRQGNQDARRRALQSILQGDAHPCLLPVIAKLNQPQHRASIGAELFDQGLATASRLVPEALRSVGDKGLSDRDRVAAIRWLRFESGGEVAKELLGLLRTSESSTLQSAALQSLGRFPSREVTEALIDNWPQWSPRLRAAAGEILFSRPDSTAAMLDAVDGRRIDPGDISMSRWTALASSRVQEVKARAEKILSQSTSTTRHAVIERYRAALDLEGDVSRGSTVFKQQCAGCHKSGNSGHEIGPNLAAAATRGAESILTNVLDPNREVNPQYVNYVVLTDDGRTITGMIDSENANSITLRRAESVRETVPRSEIELIRNSQQSLMPEGLEKAIDEQSMADLLAFLIEASKSPSE